MPYIPLYFKTLGFTPTEMSFIIAVMPISSAIFIPIVTTIADKRNCHRLALAVVALVSAGRLRAISSAIFIPIVTTIADKWNCHRLALAVVALVSAGMLRACHILLMCKKSP